MNTRQEFEKFVAKDGDTFDVIVVGGGPAGLGAALSSARNGAKTLLLEGRYFFGGVAQAALWMCFNRLFTDGKPRGGVHDLFVNKLRSFGPDACIAGKVTEVDGENLSIHPAYLRLAAFELLEEAGCYYRLYSPVVDVLKEGNKVVGVVTDGKGGRKEIRGKVVIDATGDADVAWRAGAEMTVGSEDGKFMPVTVVFAMNNIDNHEQFVDSHLSGESRVPMQKIMNEAYENGKAASIWYSFDKGTVPGVVSVNNGGLKNAGPLNGAEAYDLTIVERAGIQIAVDYVNEMRRSKFPGLEDAHLMMAGFAAVRESRRIVGDYVVTLEDSAAGVEFEDVVARRYGAIDPAGLDIGNHPPMKSGHAFPYRALLPRGLENLLVAGRCSSATHRGQCCGKSMGNMMDLGQASGVAAALAAKSGKTPRELDFRVIQKVLIGMGSKLFDLKTPS